MHQLGHDCLYRAKMTRPVRRHPTPWLQGDDTTELENKARVAPPEELDNVKYDKAIADHKPEGLKPCEEPYAHEEKENSNRKCKHRTSTR